MLTTDAIADQAAGLRRMAEARPVRVLAVASGKGGVGKTNVSVNLAVALSAQGNATMLLDADLGLANVDVMLGLTPSSNLSHVLNGECGLEEIILPGPGDIQIIPASSGVQRMAELSTTEHAAIVHAFSELSTPVDSLVVDTAAGISSSVVRFAQASHEVVVVVCDEPAALTDSYALIKVLSKEYDVERFHVLANMVDSPHQGRELFGKLARATERFLDVQLNFLGTVPHDDYLRKAVQRQRAVVDSYPRSRAAAAFRTIADKTTQWPVPKVAGGHLEFFVERVINSGVTDVGPPT